MSRPPFQAGRAELLISFGEWIRRVPLGSGPLVLGRGEDCDVELPDRRVSRRHCAIRPGPGEGWLVEDLGSSTGTLLRGAALSGPAELRPGDRVEIGSTCIELRWRAESASVLSGDPEHDARSVQLLLQTVGELYGTRDQGELLRTIVDRAVLLAGGERGALFLAAPGAAVEVAVARDASGRDLPPDQALPWSLPERAIRTGRAVVLKDTDTAGGKAAVPESVLEAELRCVLCVPLPGQDGAAGVLYVDARRPAEAFGATDLAIFEALAVQAALAIERARRELEGRERLESENAVLRARLGAGAPIGQSPAMLRALEMARRLAASDATVCLLGETGTGKEVFARHLHQLSPRAGGPFVVVDCGALPESLIESELFGHEKGAFTGATSSRKGRFREAEGGTVFLDEIAELPAGLQTRLLRVVQERTVQPLGGAAPVPVDVRLVCATHQDLERKVAAGQFRQDLYYRLGVLTIPIPALRERGEDLPMLARHFLARQAEAYGVRLAGFTREALEALLAHGWPGNVRELEQRVQRAVLLASPPFITRSDLGLGEDREAAAPAGQELPLPPLQEGRAAADARFERAYLEEALRRAGGRVAEAARLAGVSRSLLHRLLRRHGLESSRYAQES